MQVFYPNFLSNISMAAIRKKSSKRKWKHSNACAGLMTKLLFLMTGKERVVKVSPTQDKPSSKRFMLNWCSKKKRKIMLLSSQILKTTSQSLVSDLPRLAGLKSDLQFLIYETITCS